MADIKMFDLEKNEKIVIIFLITVSVLALAVKVYKKYQPGFDLKVIRTEPVKRSGPGDETSRQSAGLININEAGPEDLVKLKHVGKALAGRIIDYRNSKGRFESVSEIKNVKGIGDSIFEDIKDKICVE